MKTSLFVPAKCIICNAYAAPSEMPVCEECLYKLQYLLSEKCPHCGNTARDCSCISDIHTPFLFRQDTAKMMLYRFKYWGDKRYMRFLAEFGIKAAGINTAKFDGVTYVPRLPRRKRRYGFDQSKQLAKAISQIYSIPFVPTLKRKGGLEQKLLSRGARIKNAKDKYKVICNPEKKYKNLLLVDDVTTTGATLKVCAMILRENCASRVTLFALAKTPTLQPPF